MIIIVYSGTVAGSVSHDLGKADYSYYFILEKYLPVLRKLGEVRFVNDPASEVDDIYHAALERGDTAVFLSFSPPHNTARSLRCPTACVMAWEFGSIPDEDVDGGGFSIDWVSAIREIGNVITISDYATRVIRRQVGSGVRVVTIPAPVDAQEKQGAGVAAGAPAVPGGQRVNRVPRPALVMAATLVDSWQCDIDAERVTVRGTRPDGAEARDPVWDGREVNWAFVSKGESAGQYLVGFYAEEDWGCWSRTPNPEIILPWRVQGDFEIELAMVGYGENQGRRIDIRIGDCTRTAVLGASMTSFKLQFSLAEAADSIHFSGLVAVPLPGARDHRTLGLGLSKLALRSGSESQTPAGGPAPPERPGANSGNSVSLQLDGTVYTSVLNPEDGRKNWKDIVTAFCWAFRDDAGKTLVLKMSHHNKSVFMGDLLLLFSKLHPFSCRVVAIHGFLLDEQLRELVQATDFYVNASSAEGQCLPLLEFMVEGVPAIAPDHTAMENYISEQSAFVVRSSLAPQAWPIDPRRAYRTTTQRISWDSLCQCFLDSAQVLENEPGRYLAMAAAAATKVTQQYSSSRIEQELARFLGKLVAKHKP
jgi:glycosyltransferase involved in cell wall biosynthesis